MSVPVLYIHETACFSGAEESLLNLARFIDKERFSPVFILPEEGLFSRKLAASGVPVFFVAMPRIRDLKGVVEAARRIRAIAVRHRAAVVHTNSIRSHLYGAFAAKTLRLPLVWHERNLLTTERVDPDRALAFVPDAIVCNSLAIAARFARRGKLPGKVLVIHNGVDPARFNPSVSGKRIREEFAIADDDIVVGVASRFAPDKGHETLFRAVRLLRDRSTEISRRLRLFVVGGAVFAEDAQQEERLRRLAAGLGLGETAIFAGIRDDMPEAYAAMDLFVLASDAEPCGRVLFEAMASGKSMVATNTGGTPEIVADGVTGFLVRPGDPEEFARFIGILASDAAKRDAMGRSARRRAEEAFSIERNVRRTEETYLKLLRP